MKNKTKKMPTDKVNNKSQTTDSALHLSQEPTFTLKNLQNDELISALANAHENKRARQIIEWEQVQRKNLIRAI